MLRELAATDFDAVIRAIEFGSAEKPTMSVAMLAALFGISAVVGTPEATLRLMFEETQVRLLEQLEREDAAGACA